MSELAREPSQYYLQSQSSHDEDMEKEEEEEGAKEEEEGIVAFPPQIRFLWVVFLELSYLLINVIEVFCLCYYNG